MTQPSPDQPARPRYQPGEAIEYTSFDSSGWSAGKVDRYAPAFLPVSSLDDPLVYIQTLSGSAPFPVRESQLRRPATAYALSEDRMTLVTSRRVPAGRQIVTVRRQDGTGPFTGADVTAAISNAPAVKQGAMPGQRYVTRRTVTRYGTLWTHIMLGPPTWWAPRLKREKDGTVMAGWLRAAVAVKLDRKERAPG
jgi:hypothetical protein